MRLPDQYPAVPYAAYVDTIGPAVDADFLNFGQEAFQDIWGGLVGRSASIIADEFEELQYPAGTFGKFGGIASINTSRLNVEPLDISQHGVWHVFATAAGAMGFTTQDASSWIGTFDFTFSGKTAIDALAELDVLATGFEFGLRDNVIPSRACFVAGNDSPNWNVILGAVVHDTGIPIVDGQFYELQLARKNGTAYAYVDGTLVVSAAYAADLRNLVRSMRITSPGASMGNGFYVDCHRVWYQR